MSAVTGPELKEKRKSLNMTQGELGEKLGVSNNTVARWEGGSMAIPPYLHLALTAIKPKRSTKKAK